MKATKSISIIFWTARIIGSLLVAFTIIFFIGSMLEGQNKPSQGLDNYTIIAFVILGLGLAGLLLAMWNPGTGGLISLISFVVLNILVSVNPNPGSRYTPVMLLFILPSILFLFAWWLNKNQTKHINN